MSSGIGIGNLALETLFGLAGIFLLFSPGLLSWSGWNYIYGIFFIALAIFVVYIKR